MATPRTTIKIDGSVIDPATHRMVRSPLNYWQRDNVPSFRIARRGGPFPTRPDPWNGKEIEVLQDFGHGDLSVFRGDLWDIDTHQENIGEIFEYMAIGIRDRMDRIPVTDDTTNRNQMAFNQAPDDPALINSRSGRTCGQILLSVLEGAVNSANLRSRGIGKYSSSGAGASAGLVIAGGVVTGITSLIGGSGYTVAPTCVIVGGGGTGAAASVAVSGGVVTGISITNGGSGYTSPPVLILTTLPAITVTDLSTLDVIPPNPVTISGEKLGNAIEGHLKDVDPNYFMHVMPDGTIRFFDTRKFGTTTVTISGDGTGGKAAALIYNESIVEFYIINPGSGYTTASVTVTDTGTGSGASGSVTITSGSLSDITVISGGSGYGGCKITMTLDAEIDPPTIKSSLRSCYQRLVLNGANYIEPVILKLSDGTLLKKYAHDGLTTAQSEAAWKWADYSSPSLNAGSAVGTAVLDTGGVSTSGQSFSPGTGGTNGTYNATLSGGGGTGATATYTISGGVITAFTITNGGSGYSTAPTVSFPLGGITSASGTVVLVARAVNHFVLLDGGYGYSTAITYPVVVTGGGGTGATATVTITGHSVSAINKTSGGSGYTSAPTVFIGGAISPTCDYGSCSVPTSVTITITSADPTRTWAANVWDQSPSGKHASIYLVSTTLPGIYFSVNRKVVANTALPAGGTCTITLDLPVPASSYSVYTLRGTAGGACDVYRLYEPADPTVAATMTNEPFTRAYPWHNSSGTGVSSTSYNTCSILYSSIAGATPQESPLGIEVDPVAKTIRTLLPVVKPFGTQSKLDIGGSSIDGIPTDIIMLVGINKSLLQSICPPDVGSPPVPDYAGTSHTIEGRSETKYLQVSGWRDLSNQANMDKLACNLLDAYKDTLFSGSFTFDTIFVPAIAPGVVVNFEGENGEVTGWESINTPVTSLQVAWPPGSPVIHHSSVSFSNQRNPLAAQNYLAPAQFGVDVGSQGEMPLTGYDTQSLNGNAPVVSVPSTSVPTVSTPNI